MIIQSGLADRHDFFSAAAGDEFGHAEIRLFMRVMRMRAGRAINLGEALCDRQQFRLPPYARRDGDHAIDTGSAGSRHHGIQLMRKIREVEMAVAVDQHWVYCVAAADSTYLGKTAPGAGSLAPAAMRCAPPREA